MGPLVFTPYLRPQVWGGRRLQTLFNKRLPDEAPYGESWEISGHPHHVSRVGQGRFVGTLLTDLCRDHRRELFGDATADDRAFPLLIKLLDCNDLLSIQVHPSDEIAARLLKDERGKTEAWVVLEVQPQGVIYAGLKEGVDRAELQRHLDAGTTDQCLHAFHPSAGDCLLLTAGTVHAVGAGVVMAEVQQSSDATFRLFDWNRVGMDGRPRTLHIRESLDSIDFRQGPVAPVAGVSISELPAGVTGQSLVACRYFMLDRFEIAGAIDLETGARLSMWMVLAGRSRLVADDFDQVFAAGATVLIPACVRRFHWYSADAATLLRIRLPA